MEPKQRSRLHLSQTLVRWAAKPFRSKLITEPLWWAARIVAPLEEFPDQRYRFRWRRRLLRWAVSIGGVLALLLLIRFGYAYRWTGFGQYKVNGAIQPFKTLWEWLDLLIIPIVLAIGGYLFTRSENRVTQAAAERRAQDDALQAYLDTMSSMLIPIEKQPSLYKARPGDSLSSVARARTLTVLQRLDGDRRARVVGFLYEAGLVNRDLPVLDLRKASLNNAHLRKVHLSGADLRGINLSQADLSGADLRRANLQGANLSGADLRWANLSGTDLAGADFRDALFFETDLSGADLRGANLSLVHLSNMFSDLSGADLSLAKLTGANLSWENLSEGNLWQADLREAKLRLYPKTAKFSSTWAQAN